MEKVVGPVDGYYAAIFARELNGRFRASYKICATAPADYRSACPLKHARVDGVSDTLARAFELAEQLARLRIARLRDRAEAKTAMTPQPTVAVEFESSWGDGADPAGSGRMYAATDPCPLYPTPAN